MTRKEFITRGGRMIILAGLATAGGYLVHQKRVTATCTASSACNACGQFNGCSQPQAEEVRRNERDGSTEDGTPRLNGNDNRQDKLQGSSCGQTDDKQAISREATDQPGCPSGTTPGCCPGTSESSDVK